MFWKKRKTGDFSAEVEAHLELEAERLKEQGLSYEEARAAARRQFGNVTRAEERFVESTRWTWWENIWQDIRLALRMLRKSPGFAAVAVLTLALGIGANTAVFSVIHSVLIKSLPYPDPQRLVVLNEYTLQNGEASVGWMDFLDWKAQSQDFDAIAIYRQHHFSLTGLDKPDVLRTGEVSSSFFSLVGANTVVGRVFNREEDAPGAQRTVVLSYAFWRSRLNGDPAAVGRALTLDGTPYTVVGVLSPDLKFFQSNTDLYVPAGLKGDDPNWLSRSNHQGYKVLARLRPGVTLAAARSSLETIMLRLEQQYSDSNHGVRASVTPLYESIVGNVQRSLLILLIASICVLLIACANVANLSLARAAGRAREFAIRGAIGARRWRLIRQLMTESLVLFVIGGALGFLCARLAIQPLLRLAPDDIPRLADTQMNTGMFLFTFAAAVMTGVVFGIVPAWQGSRVDLTTPLREAGRNVSSVRQHQRFRAALLIAEVALAFVLVISSGLLIRSLREALDVNPGFQADHLLALDVNLPATKYKTDAQQTAFLTQTLDRLRSLPGVESASAAFCPPLVGACWDSTFTITGRPAPQGSRRAAFNVAEAGYFETLHTPLLAGRFFTAADTKQSPQVALINETMARRWWPNESPIGKRIVQNSPQELEIIGVVGDLKEDGVDEKQWPEVFEAASQNTLPLMTLVVRTSTDPAAMASAAEKAIHQVDQDQPVYHVQPMTAYLETSLVSRKFETLLLGVFSVLALLLAAVGIYGLVGYMVTQRTYEIGIRMALGAQKRSVLALVLGFGLKLVICGVAIGLAISFAVTRVLESLLFGVSGHDPLTFAGVTVLLALVAIAACWIPARRAVAVDPMIALRFE